MKTINVAELKTHLSRYLRLVRQGEHIVVLDRKEPIAELSPLRAEETSPWIRLEREGKVTLGSQEWTKLRTSSVKRKVPIQRLLRDVREDVGE